jgi:hypothetical protein
VPPPDKVFDTADADGDRAVTKEELASVMGKGSADELFSKSTRTAMARSVAPRIKLSVKK